MSVSDAQKSEIHQTTADASTSPTAANDEAPTRSAGKHTTPWNQSKLVPEPPINATIVKDDTDAGGPLVIKSDDPDLNPPRAPIDPFPTLGTPEIDAPVELTKRSAGA